jgi:lactoylglutathione lyase
LSERAFPVVYARDVARTVRFYESLGFEEHFRLPEEEPGYVGLRRGSCEVSVVTVDSPRELIGLEVGEEPRFEMFVYVDDVDARVEALRRDGIQVLREPNDMFWGERVAYVADPDGNPVALAKAAAADYGLPPGGEAR